VALRKKEGFKQNLENNTQNMMKVNGEMKTFMNWRKAKLNTGIDMELLRKMEENTKNLENTSRNHTNEDRLKLLLLKFQSDFPLKNLLIYLF